MDGLLDKTQPFLSYENNIGQEQLLYGLKPEIVKGLNTMGLIYPTLVQAKAIPIILKGKDVMIRAKTGTGKTIAYLAPIVHSLLNVSNGKSCVGVVFLPSTDLALQVEHVFKKLSKYTTLSCLNLCFDDSKEFFMSKKSQLIISTPEKFLSAVESNPKNAAYMKSMLEFVVVDEADLVCEFGHSTALSKIMVQFIPQTSQRVMISATLFDITAKTKDSLAFLKSVMLVNPVKISLTEETTGDDYSDITNVTQHYVLVDDVSEKDRLLYALLYLKLISGKVLFFVNSCNDSYNYQLLLESFVKKRVIVINKLLTKEARFERIQQFNKSVSDFIIVADEETAGKSAYNISRGVDFEGVKFVVNIGCPNTVEQYIHRIGRTARAGLSGSSLLILLKHDSKENSLLNELTKVMPPQNQQGSMVEQPSLLKLDTKDLLPFKYRVEDARSRVTKTAIQLRKVKELQLNILQSDRFCELSKQKPGNLSFIQSKSNKKSNRRHNSVLLPKQVSRKAKKSSRRRRG